MGGLLIPVLILIDLLAGQGETMVVRRYGRKYGDGGLFFNAIICLFASVFFFVTDKGGLCFPKELWGYGLVSCVMFATGFYTMYLALSTGSYVGSKMFSSFSSIIPIFYGILILQETVSIPKWIGIILVFVTVILKVTEGVKGEDTKDASVSWYIYLLLSAVSNGFISVITKMQQLRFDHMYDNEFMIISFLGSFVFLFVMAFIKERGKTKGILGKSILYGAGAGIFNGGKNFLNLIILLYLPISVSTPLRQGLGIIVGFLISTFLYKEKYTRRKIIALVVGAVAVMMFRF